MREVREGREGLWRSIYMEDRDSERWTHCSMAVATSLKP